MYRSLYVFLSPCAEKQETILQVYKSNKTSLIYQCSFSLFTSFAFTIYSQGEAEQVCQNEITPTPIIIWRFATHNNSKLTLNMYVILL